MGKHKQKKRDVHSGRSNQEVDFYNKHVLSSIADSDPTIPLENSDDSDFSQTSESLNSKESVIVNSSEFRKDPIGKKIKDFFINNGVVILISGFLITAITILINGYISNNRELGEHKEKLLNIDRQLETVDKKITIIEDELKNLNNTTIVYGENLKYISENLKDLQSDIKKVRNTAKEEK